ncbi:uncharacterized protein LOC115996003 [Ipomoea triloba]|uniref:uncharacterized protein LOC115996003 n=1 Tax=Ipomoea triloba TaxID=35885 RepID=UPI00125E7005|nr:uncharacterized protein LOC115996003 [Ipomoea triloba]
MVKEVHLCHKGIIPMKGIIVEEVETLAIKGRVVLEEVVEDQGVSYVRGGGVEESAYHLFVECPEAAPLWTGLGVPAVQHEQGNVVDWFFALIAVLDEDIKCKFVILCWGIWGSRNELVWKGNPFVRHLVATSSLNFLASWKVVQECDQTTTAPRINIETWRKPSHGRLKMNTDAALDVVNNSMGLGWVLRDDEGRFLACKSLCISGCYGVKEAEALCIREALSWLKDTGMGDVDVETDSQLVYYALRSNSFNSAFGFILNDVKEVASMINGVDFCFAKRSANRAAHTVAREVVSMSGCGEWFDTPPPFLVDYLSDDLMN